MSKPKLTGKDRIFELKQLAKDKEQGKQHVAMPLITLPKLNGFLGGMQKGLHIAITAEPNVGKTPLVKAMIYSAYKACKTDNNRKFKCIFFALEESEEQFIDTLILTVYYEMFNKFLDYHLLLSISTQSISDKLWNELDIVAEEVDEFLTHVRVIDYLYNPYDIYDFCLERIQKLGKEKGNKFIYDDLSCHYFCVVDNLNLFRTTDYKEKHGLMETWSAEHATSLLCKKYKWTVISVIQQTIDPNREQWSKGARIVSKLEPSMHSIGNNKETARHFQIIMGVFAPSFYEVKDYHGHTIDDFIDHSFRSIIILKNRYGRPKAYIYMMLLNNTFAFVQLHKKDDLDYEIIKHKAIETLAQGKEKIEAVFDDSWPPADDPEGKPF